MAAGVYHGTYDPEKVIITFGKAILHGFIDGDYVKGSFDEERYFKLRGVDGEASRSRNPSRAGNVEINLMQTSSANRVLSNLLFTAGRTDITKPVPFSIVDLSGKSLLFSSKSWIKSTPDFSFGMEVGECKWIFDCADLEVFYAGTEDNSLAGMIGF